MTNGSHNHTKTCIRRYKSRYCSAAAENICKMCLARLYTQRTKSFMAIQPMDSERAADGLWASNMKIYLHSRISVRALCNYVGVDEGRLRNTIAPHIQCTKVFEKLLWWTMWWTRDGNLYP